LLAPMGHILQPTDASALHYRHLSPQLCRQLSSGRPMDEVLLDRARGYTISVNDPVTGGAHCAIGGGDFDFVVTSTLASQTPPAVGRALGFKVAQRLIGRKNTKFPANAISLVTVGDGSVNNGHFLSATNLAEYAKARNFQCPIVFGVSDNNRCISLPGHGWLQKYVKRFDFPVYRCNGVDMLDVYDQFSQAVKYSRASKKPCMILFEHIPRRFGHAATDRQASYLTPAEIQSAAEHPVLAPAVRQAVENGVESYSYFYERYKYICEETSQAFAKAHEEPKITSREEMINFNSQPLISVSRKVEDDKITKRNLLKKGDVMRKLMNEVMRELLTDNPNSYYLGEDVTHGGYYLVTEGIAKEFPSQILDFPPDETTIVGCGMGFSQCGIFPIVEIPYAKYLDCAADMFFEACITNWLTKGKAPVGMIIRLQGFGVGVFGGNFHTHNMLHIPPGLDVVCYSNGSDYVKGWRYLATQAKAGRLVMSVDSTHLLNERHVHDKDNGWLQTYPSYEEYLDFDTVIKYGNVNAKTAIVTYGSGVLFSLRALKTLEEQHNNTEVCVIDCPLLSGVPQQLRESMKNLDNVIFADVCKEGSAPLSLHLTQMQKEKCLPKNWSLIGGTRTYNPLGTTLTFLNPQDITHAVLDIQGMKKIE